MKLVKFVGEVTVTDPDTKNPVELSIYKHPNGGMFAIDSSYLDQCFEDDEPIVLPDFMDVDAKGNTKDFMMLCDDQLPTDKDRWVCD